MWILFGDWSAADRPFAPVPVTLPPAIDLLDLEPLDTRFPAFARRDGLAERLAADVPDLDEAVREAHQARVLVGAIAGHETLDWLRELTQAALALFEAGGIAMLDANGFRWWSEDTLRARLIEEREPRHLVRWIASAEGTGIWLRTAGLATFGRPDVSVRGLAPEDRPAAEEVVGRLVSLSVDGARVPDGQEVAWDGRTWRCRVRRDGPDAAAFAGNAWVELQRVAS
jgi:hypothetical protein